MLIHVLAEDAGRMEKIKFLIKLFIFVKAALEALNEWAKKIKKERELRELEKETARAELSGRPTSALNSVYADDSTGVQRKPEDEDNSE